MLSTWALLLLPLVALVACALLRDPRRLAWAHGLSATLVVGLGLWTVGRVANAGAIDLVPGWLRLDALSAWLILIVVLVGGWAAWYSVPYLNEEYRRGVCTRAKVQEYYLLFHLFWGTMLWVGACDNLGLLWVAIEATTLSSAFLVAFYNEKAALEAAWKYVILSSVGIALALFGTMLLYFSSLPINGGGVLNWVGLLEDATQLNAGVLKLAFVLALIGYGTKVGLAPMHTWLPDAHSQAPAPISAMLSGVLLSCAFYALMRFHLILIHAGLGGFSAGLLLVFGALTVSLAALFILTQGDYKRLLAYSSVENMGLAAVGLGFNVRWAVFGALLQLLFHALTKALLFLASGFIYLRYDSKRIEDVSGVLNSAPGLGVAFFAGVLAITGVPPFGVFMSKFMILSAGFSSHNGLVSVALLAALALVFGGFLYHTVPMVLGRAPSLKRPPLRTSWWPLLALAGVLLGLGLYLPAPLLSLIDQVLELMQL